jgi:hypothetical protein
MHSSTLLRRKLILCTTGPEDFNREITDAEDDGWKVIPESLCISSGDAILYGVFVEKTTDE